MVVVVVRQILKFHKCNAGFLQLLAYGFVFLLVFLELYFSCLVVLLLQLLTGCLVLFHLLDVVDLVKIAAWHMQTHNAVREDVHAEGKHHPFFCEDSPVGDNVLLLVILDSKEVETGHKQDDLLHRNVLLSVFCRDVDVHGI